MSRPPDASARKPDCYVPGCLIVANYASWAALTPAIPMISKTALRSRCMSVFPTTAAGGEGWPMPNASRRVVYATPDRVGQAPSRQVTCHFPTCGLSKLRYCHAAPTSSQFYSRKSTTSAHAVSGIEIVCVSTHTVTGGLCARAVLQRSTIYRLCSNSSPNWQSVLPPSLFSRWFCDVE